MDSPLVGLIKEAQAEGMRPENWKLERIKGENTRFVQDSWGLLTHRGWVWVPMSGGVRQIILEEAHMYRFSIHPEASKMYRDLRMSYWCL